MKRNVKKLLSSALALCLSAGLISSASAENTVITAEEAPSVTPVYLMDFNPDKNDGKFYDSPEGTTGRVEVPRKDNPGDINLVTTYPNTDDKIIRDSSNNSSKLVSSAETIKIYTAFSNNGASGTSGDTSLKTARLSDTSSSTLATATLKFPEAYGGTGDANKKYRFEADWMYYSSASSSAEFQDGIIILNLVFGDGSGVGNGIQLKTKKNKDATSGARPNEYRTGNPLAFYDGDNDSKSHFGFTPGASDTKETNLNDITKSANGIGKEMNGKWIHITIDIDFNECKLYAKLEGENFEREFTGEATKGKDDFKKGLQGVKLCGNKNSVSYINFFDNVKITPIEKKEISDITKANNTATVNITAGAGFDKPLSLFAAEYSADGTLKSVKKSEAKEFGAGTKGSIEVSTEGMVENNTRFFLWDSALKPVKTYTTAASASESE